LRELERRFPRELAVVGVHSGKYIAERETPNIREAAHRLGVHHAIVNDRHFRVWRSYAVRAWPTIVAVDPAGRVVGMHAGEFTSEMLEPFVERMIGAFDPAGELDRRPLAVEEPPPAAPVDRLALRYPGKVATDGRRVAIADTGRARVLVGTLARDGRRLRVERIVGGEDGPDGERLVAPQGLVLDGDTLYVADPGAHLVRAISLADGTVRAVAGTGAQLRTRADLEAGALSSPWDLALADGALYVAMAGVHRLWRVPLGGGAPAPFSGSGREELRDGAHDTAALAQPMGIVAHAGALWFADAESSAVRRADLDPAGGVTTLVGTGLFDFGDVDGVGDAVRLQHPQGLAAAPDGRLLVADSYNDALKWLDPTSRSVTTWVRGFAEPTGVAIARDLVYVADTNAHRVAVVELVTGAVSTLELE
jgi:hypothetical protein